MPSGLLSHYIDELPRLYAEEQMVYIADSLLSSGYAKESALVSRMNELDELARVGPAPQTWGEDDMGNVFDEMSFESSEQAIIEAERRINTPRKLTEAEQLREMQNQILVASWGLG